jgi:rhomboid protease GluP
MIDESESIIRVVRNETLAHDWELVLLSQGLSPQLRGTPDGIALTVPRREADRALAGLAAYDKESSPKAHRADVTTNEFDLSAGVIAGSLLVCFFAVTNLWNAVPWLERGSANAAKILDGELWRTVTALTLHGDVAHVLSNGFAMAVFFGAVSGQLGTGIAAVLIATAGAGGNLANAYLQGSPHDAVGVSTAVFGAVGMLGSFAMMRRRRAIESRRRAWVTIAAALALLGMLGSGGARVDVLAHLFGFLAGGALGIPAALLLLRPTGVAVQWLCGAATIALIVYCWILALH